MSTLHEPGDAAARARGLCAARAALHSRSGLALVTTVVMVTVLAAMASVFLAVGSSSGVEVAVAQANARAFYLAEAGITEGLESVRAAVVAEQEGKEREVPERVGDEKAPLGLYSGSYWVSIDDDGADTYTLLSTGVSGNARRAIEVVVMADASGAFDNALFAGNRSGDPNYKLKFGGTGASGDAIEGDVYSGGDVSLSGDAQVTGTIRANGAISGGAGKTGIAQDIPDLAAMNYAVNHDVDVAKEFKNGGPTYKSAAAGGNAWQLPEANPAHIFRKNASDRASEYKSTAKDDYFLEDPYEPLHKDVDQDGSDPYPLTLSGTAGTPGPDTSNKVFYVDGNLWIHNTPAFSFRFAHDKDESVKVTFAVLGNVYFSDNLFYQDAVNDAVAFLALADPGVADSGNIYFGDPQGGTLEHMQAFMYAENDFIDYHLDAAGSKKVKVVGSMSAGEHVDIKRDYKGHHSKLTVEFDDRVSKGTITLPGLPPQIANADGLQIISWREVPVL